MTDDPAIAPPDVKERLWTKDYTFLCLANFLTFMAFYILMPILPIYLADHLGIMGWQAGMVMGIYAVSAIGTRIICGFLVDNYGRKRVYLSALVGFTFFYFFYLPVSTFAAFMVLRLLHGLAWGMIMPAGQTALVDVVPFSRRGEGIGLFGLSVALATALSPSAGLFIVSFGNYDMLFLVSAGIALLGFAIAAAVRYLPAPPKQARQALAFSQVFERTSIPVGLMAFFCLMGYGGVMNWSAVLALEIDGASAGVYFLWLSLGIIIARLISGRLYDRHGPRMLCLTACALMATSCFMLGAASDSVVFYSAGFVSGIGTGVFMPICLAMVNTMVRIQHRGAANSTYSALFEAGIASGVILTGALYPFLGLSNVYHLYGAITAAAAVAFLALVLPYFNKHRLEE